MEPLLTRGWDAVHADIDRAEHVLLATDFDGTLAPIVPRPELARMSETDRDSLRAISRRERYSVAIVTGRRMEEIRSLAKLGEVYYAANYGMEIDGPNGFRFREPEGDRARFLVASLAPQLESSLADIEGAVVENKSLSVTVHYRHVRPEMLASVRNRVKDVTAADVSAGHIRVSEGNRAAIEVVPMDSTDKGNAIALILDRMREVGTRPWPIYMGDDVMDEDGFRLVNDRGGASIIVGPEDGVSTDARFFVDSPADVSRFLARVVAVSEGRPWN